MSNENLEDIRDTAIKLGVIHSKSPTDYAYLKGWIHCLSQKTEKQKNTKIHNSSESVGTGRKE